MSKSSFGKSKSIKVKKDQHPKLYKLLKDETISNTDLCDMIEKIISVPEKWIDPASKISRSTKQLDALINHKFEELEKFYHPDHLSGRIASYLENYIESELHTIGEKSEKLTEIYENLLCTSSKAATKGALGENLVRKIIEEYFPECETKNVSKNPGMGDLLIILNGYTIMIEIKNYSRNVPTKEQEKFIKDLRNNKCYDAGIFISLNVGIAKRKKLDYELIKNKPAIFVPKVNLDNNGTAIIWPIIFTLKYLDILKKRKEKNINSQTSELKNEADLMDIIYEENEKLFDLIEQNQNLCTKIEKYKKSQQKLIDSHIKDIYKFIENNVNQIKSITKNFSNGLDS